MYALNNWNTLTRILQKAMLLPLILVLAGCQTEIYSNLDERQANDMVQVLESDGISVERERSSDGTYTLRTDGASFSQAVASLSRAGLPREQFESLGEVFAGDKLVVTSFEEKVRFVYGLEQELANSLTRIAGVTSARVHISLPEQKANEEVLIPSSAAIFIYHVPEVNMGLKIAVIKNLIVNSTEGLNYEDVAVALFPMSTASTTASRAPFNPITLLLPLALIAAAIWFYRRNRRPVVAGGAA